MIYGFDDSKHKVEVISKSQYLATQRYRINVPSSGRNIRQEIPLPTGWSYYNSFVLAANAMLIPKSGEAMTPIYLDLHADVKEDNSASAGYLFSHSITWGVSSLIFSCDILGSGDGGKICKFDAIEIRLLLLGET